MLEYFLVVITGTLTQLTNLKSRKREIKFLYHQPIKNTTHIKGNLKIPQMLEGNEKNGSINILNHNNVELKVSATCSNIFQRDQIWKKLVCIFCAPEFIFTREIKTNKNAPESIFTSTREIKSKKKLKGWTEYKSNLDTNRNQIERPNHWTNINLIEANASPEP